MTGAQAGSIGAAAAVRPRTRRQRTRVRIRRLPLLAAFVAAALATAYIAWFRDSGLVRVERVEVTGLSTVRAGALRAALERAGRRMTTLDVDSDALRSAVAADPLVRSLRADGQFPHALRIEVTLNLPVAALRAGSHALPVAGDGTLLPGLPATGLPAVYVAATPTGRRLAGARAQALVALAGAIPGPLRPRIQALSVVPGRGLCAHIATGPLLILGDARDAAAKWRAAAAVLASGAATASYIDLRAPLHPIAGGLPNGSTAQPDAYAGAIPATTSTPAPASGQPNPVNPSSPH